MEASEQHLDLRRGWKRMLNSLACALLLQVEAIMLSSILLNYVILYEIVLSYLSYLIYIDVA